MKFEKVVVITALIWFTVTAILSVGYFHTDEHYQIIEFANYLSAENDVQDLAWEFEARLRPSLQPVICHYIFSACEVLHVTSPYSKAIILRILSGFFAIVCIYILTKKIKPELPEKYWRSFFVLSFFLWFVPFLNVRFSSENWSALILMLGVSQLITPSKSKYHHFIVGVLFGLSFLFRYQVAIAVIGILLWVVFIQKISFVNVLKLVCGGVFVTGIGVVIDYLFYQEFSLTLWNYFQINLIEGKASEFGVSPWYSYFKWVVRYSASPVGVLILGSYMYFIVKNPKHLFTWLSIPFILIHCLISHKELRFLFPLVNFVPFVVCRTFADLRLTERFDNYKIISLIGAVVIVTNSFALSMASTIPLDFGRIEITRFLYNKVQERNTKLFYLDDCNVYSPYNIPTNYYKNDNVLIFHVDSCMLTDREFNGLFVIRAKDKEREKVNAFIENNQLKLLHKGTPNYAYIFMKIYGSHTGDIIELYGND